MSNRLAAETSPYLLQHKDNPVDWYPWGDDAFERARTEDKPLLLSVGYAACHWCHVMEHESFEDEETARIMNEHFVCVKVDREERPDVDSVYMEAVQTMTGQGGWPMTMFLTPEGTPFYGGTYFPPADRHGLPGFKKLLMAIAQAWRERKQEVIDQGAQLVRHLGVTARLGPSAEPISHDLLAEASKSLQAAYDPIHGGFGGAGEGAPGAKPKFPQPMVIDFLLRRAAHGHLEAETMARTTLDAMAAGGMFDQVGGGFARYSVDARWVVPHFEKMLYDNAQLLRTYARAWQAFEEPRYREVAEATAAWMLGEMRDEGGGLWASLDADSEGVEGKFYVWSLDEVRSVTGDDADAAIAHWGFTEEGNFEGLNIPVFARDVDDPEAVERARRALLERRATRVRPEADTKVLTGWNALAASALAEAGTILGHADWIEAANEAMHFVFDTLRVDGRLMRSFRNSDVRHLGYCEDYALCIEAALHLYEATFDVSWLDEAIWAAGEAIRLFLDPVTGGFFSTGNDAEALVVRPKDTFDNAMPSGNSVMALELQRLAHFTGNDSYEEYALGAMQLVGDLVGRAATGFGHMLSAIDFYTAGPLEIVLVGPEETRSPLLQVVRERFIANKIVLAAAESDPAMSRLPLLAGRDAGSAARAYVCRNGTCKLPADSPAQLAEQIGAA